MGDNRIGMVATIGASRLLFSYGISHEYKMDQIITEMHLLHDPVPAIVHKKPPSAIVTPDLGHAKLQAIKERGFLRVGYLVLARKIHFLKIHYYI